MLLAVITSDGRLRPSFGRVDDVPSGIGIESAVLAGRKDVGI
jgi:hypothetical protein